MTTMQGRDKLLKRLAAMPKGVRAATSAAMQQGADEITAMQKGATPVGTGALRNSVKNVKGSYQAANKNVRGFGGSVVGDPDLTINLVAGDEKAWYAALVEFGTAPHENKGRFAGTQNPGTRPQPYFYPPYRALRRRYKARVTRAMKKAIKTGGGQ